MLTIVRLKSELINNFLFLLQLLFTKFFRKKLNVDHCWRDLIPGPTVLFLTQQTGRCWWWWVVLVSLDKLFKLLLMFSYTNAALKIDLGVSDICT